jgi:CRISPR-associated protein Csm2
MTNQNAKDWVKDIKKIDLQTVQTFCSNEKDGIGKITTTQLRKFFGAVKSIDMTYRLKPHEFNPIEVKLLLPALAYAVGREKNEKKQALEKLYNVLKAGIDEVKTIDEFNNFVSLFEAIVAYKKYADKN